MRTRLDQIEAKIQRLVEESLGRVFATDEFSQALIVNVLATMRREARQDELGQWTAPEHYQIHLHPKWMDANALELNEQIIELINQTAAFEQLGMVQSPTLDWIGNPGLGRAEVFCAAQGLPDQLRETRELVGSTEDQNRPLSHVFLIDAGQQVFYLHPQVTTIVRELGNHVCVTDERVSRQHAQIRHENGKFWLFDSNSSGGTFVNANQIEEHVLQAGEVISLAGYKLIFSVDIKDEPGATRKVAIE